MAKQKDGSYALKEYPTEKIWIKFSEKENSKKRERERGYKGVCMTQDVF